MALDVAKRRRVGLGLGATPSPGTVNSTAAGPTTISNVVLRKWSQTGGPKPTPEPEAPKYSPSDRAAMLGRLATFQEMTDWTPKPERVNEVEWAKRGWVCQGKERVRCTLCHKELVVGLNKKEVDGKEVSVLVSSEIGRFRLV